MKRKLSLSQLFLIAILFLVTLTMIVPILNIIAKSFSSPEESARMGGLAILPRSFDLINYRIVFNHPALMGALMNSIFITIVGLAINILLTCSAAYVLTRRGLTLKKPLMVFLIFMMLFDPGMVPEYLVIKDIGLMGSRWSIILVMAVNVYYLIILMRYYQAIPSEIYEAAEIDGAGHWTTLFRVVFPLAKSGIATITMFYAVIRWNEYFRAGIYLTKTKDTTLQVILRQFVILGDTTSIVGRLDI